MVIIKTDSTKIHVRSRIFFNDTYLEAIPDDGDLMKIPYEDIKYIDSNRYQSLGDKED